jgi:RNA polymerase sigma factor (sigma-70 family)
VTAVHHHHATADYVRAVQDERIANASLRRGDLDVLVAGAAAGDRAAWEALVARFQPRLLRVARSYGLNRDEAQDAVQETWIRLMRGIAGVREPRAVLGWLTTTVRRESVRILIRGRREQPTDEELGADVASDAYPDPDAHLQAEARRAELTRALDRLSPSHRRLMRALFSDTAKSYEEIADQLGMPVGSIGPIRGRCLAKLRLDTRLKDLAADLD